MSESLPGAAPLDDSAVPSAEASAPDSTQEVVTDSARGNDYVEASRFNGLMGRFNRTQSELEQARQRIAELEANPPATEGPAVTADVSALEAQVNQLTSMLMQERLESAKAKAIQEFPGAAAFADLIIADSPEAIQDMAKVLHERVTQGQAPQAPAADSGEQPAAEQAPPAAPEAPSAPVAPVVGGGTSIEGSTPDPEENVVAAIRNKSFAGFLKAKWEAQQGAGELVL